MKVLVVGNSVSVRVRPTEENVRNLSYVSLIKSQLSPSDNIQTFAESGLMVNYFAENPDRLIKEQPDVLVCNFGIVELSSRSTRRSIYDYMYYNKSRNKFGRSLSLLLAIIETKLRRSLVFLRFKRPWYNLDLFIRDYFQLINKVQKDTSTEVIILGINQPSPRVEEQLPGSLKRVKNANDIIAQKCSELKNVNYIDVNTDMNYQEHFPDGIHYNKIGHELIANKIKSVISSYQ